jgi:hypothetical protein
VFHDRDDGRRQLLERLLLGADHLVLQAFAFGLRLPVFGDVGGSPADGVHAPVRVVEREFYDELRAPRTVVRSRQCHFQFHRQLRGQHVLV